MYKAAGRYAGVNTFPAALSGRVEGKTFKKKPPKETRPSVRKPMPREEHPKVEVPKTVSTGGGPSIPARPEEPE